MLYDTATHIHSSFSGRHYQYLPGHTFAVHTYAYFYNNMLSLTLLMLILQIVSNLDII